ncbi:MAG: DUF4833 domain-containing protein [Flavipsychrobacter sp.]|nr:DUF4833 domain-containing protein [Flavipsychrobacter sp.]
MGRQFFWTFTIAFLSLMKAEANPIEEQDSMPTPFGIENLLFYVQRTPNTNTIVYSLNIKNGVLQDNNPVHIFWIRYADKGEHRELNFIQRKFAYGLTTKKTDKDRYELRFVSYDSFPLLLKKGTDGQFRVFTKIKGTDAILQRIYIKINGGTFWYPNVVYIELKGNDATTGATVIERIKP